MRAYVPICRLWNLSLMLLALLPPAARAVSATESEAHLRDIKRRRRRKQKQHRLSSSATKLSSTTSISTLNDDSNNDSLRERWVDILSFEKKQLDPCSCAAPAKYIRLENQQELQYYYRAEILADQLLGLDDDININSNRISLLRRPSTSNSLLSQELSIIWKSIVIASSGILIGIPTMVIFNTILSSNIIQSISSSITPYLLPTESILSTTIQNYKSQVSAIYHSLPYMVKHINRIKLGPLLYKLLRKCLILEAWRHIWLRVYRVTRYIWRGTLHNAKLGYNKFIPSWIRRGVKSMFQSVVQGYVHGVLGGVIGSVLSDISFEGGMFGGGGVGGGGSGDDSISFGASDDTSSLLESTTVSSMDDIIISDTISDSAAQGLESTISESVLGSAVEEIVDAVSEEAVDVVAESVTDAVESIVESVEDVVESFMDDCISEGCVDQVVESILD